jgi:hypothetical protein
MRSTKLVTTLLGAALAAVLAAPVAYAMPVDPAGSTTDSREVPYVAPPPSSIAASAGQDEEYEALRVPRGSTPVAAAEPTAPTGFDWVSAAIGAVAAAGLALVSVAAIGMRRRAAVG